MSSPSATFSHVEDHSMGVELRRGVAVNRSRGIVFELCSDELASGLGWVVAADSSLCVALKLLQG